MRFGVYEFFREHDERNLLHTDDEAEVQALEREHDAILQALRDGLFAQEPPLRGQPALLVILQGGARAEVPLQEGLRGEERGCQRGKRPPFARLREASAQETKTEPGESRRTPIGASWLSHFRGRTLLGLPPSPLPASNQQVTVVTSGGEGGRWLALLVFAQKPSLRHQPRPEGVAPLYMPPAHPRLQVCLLQHRKLRAMASHRGAPRNMS